MPATVLDTLRLRCDCTAAAVVDDSGTIYVCAIDQDGHEGFCGCAVAEGGHVVCPHLGALLATMEQR